MNISVLKNFSTVDKWGNSVQKLAGEIEKIEKNIESLKEAAELEIDIKSEISIEDQAQALLSAEQELKKLNMILPVKVTQLTQAAIPDVEKYLLSEQNKIDSLNSERMNTFNRLENSRKETKKIEGELDKINYRLSMGNQVNTILKSKLADFKNSVGENHLDATGNNVTVAGV